jgi:hypothetical protein
MAIANNPTRAGQRASKVEFFGPFSRYGVFAVHTRFDAVQWFAVDSEHPDSKPGDYVIIRQEVTREAVIASLPEVVSAD